LDWTEPLKNTAADPIKSPPTCKLKLKLNRFFRLQRTTKKTLRSIKKLLGKKIYQNEAAIKLCKIEQPPVLEPRISSKYITNRLVSRVLPFSNAWLDDDDGYISDITLKAESTSSVSKSEEEHEMSVEQACPNDCGGTDLTEIKSVSSGSERLISDLHTATTLDACPQVNSNDYSNETINDLSNALIIRTSMWAILKHKFNNNPHAVYSKLKKLKIWDRWNIHHMQALFSWIFEFKNGNSTSKFHAILFLSESKQSINDLKTVFEYTMKIMNCKNYYIGETVKENMQLQRSSDNKKFQEDQLQVFKI